MAAPSLDDHAALFADLVENSPDPLVRFDRQLRAVYVNPAAADGMGLPRAELIGRRAREIPTVPRPVVEQLDEALLSVLRTGERLVTESTLPSRTGPVAYQMVLVPSVLDGVVEHVTAYLRDVSRYKHEARRLTAETLLDPLTRISNRRALLERADKALASAALTSPVALLFVDLDEFKRVNTDLGHAAGDEVLSATAARLRAAVRSTDVVGRLGGDEFVILCAEVSHADAHTTARRVLEAVCRPHRLTGGQTVSVAASIGLAVFTGAVRAGEALQLADRRMRKAKRSGKGRVVVD